MARVVKPGFSKEVAFELRPEQIGEHSPMNVWRKSMSGGRNSKCKGPEAGLHKGGGEQQGPLQRNQWARARVVMPR